MLNVAFRVDASNRIGTGHVRRCLTLANQIRSKGGDVRFFCRSDEGNLNRFIQSQGYECHIIDTSSPCFSDQLDPITDIPLPYERLLPSSQISDASQFISLVSKWEVDWVIVDHYALGSIWERRIKSQFSSVKVFVIDDLVNRAHDCDILLDQTYLRSAMEYQQKVPKNCICLTGQAYSLIRDEFKKAYLMQRKQDLDSRNTLNILISLGGVDIDNATEKIIKAFHKLSSDVRQWIDLTVVIGNQSNQFANLKRLNQTEKIQMKLLKGTNEMAKLMMHSDLVVTASGTTVWEVCALNKAFILLKTAENQTDVFNKLAPKMQGAAYSDVKKLLAHIEHCQRVDFQNMAKFEPHKHFYVGFDGAEKVAEHLFRPL